MNLKTLINDIQNNNNNNSLSKLILEFEPIINNICKGLPYPEAKSDLYIFLINLSKNINTEKYCKDNILRWTFIKSLKHKKIDLFRKNILKSIKYTELITDITSTSLNEFESIIEIKDLISLLSKKEQKIIIDKFFYNRPDVEIANELSISRQAVNKTKNKALKTLKILLEKH